jgi:hypothetical protein
MEDAQIRGFGSREVGPARLKLAFDVAAFDAKEVLACLNTGARANQQFRDCSSRSGAKRQDIARALDASRRRRGDIGSLGRPDDAPSPPGGCDNQRSE